MIDPLFSKNMHLHTERKGSYFPKNSINEISQRYDFAMVYCDKQNILEIGPGTGFGSKNIIKRSRKYKCIEYSKENCDEFKKNYPHIEIINNDFIKTNLSDEKFESIISMANIYYFDFNQFISKCNEHLNVGGNLIFCTTNVLHASFIKAPFTTKYYKLSEMQELLNNHNFTANFYGTFKSNVNNVNKKKNQNKITTLMKSIIPRQIINFLKIITKKNILLSEVESQRNLNDKPEMCRINNDIEARDYVVLYCIAKKA